MNDKYYIVVAEWKDLCIDPKLGNRDYYEI